MERKMARRGSRKRKTYPFFLELVYATQGSRIDQQEAEGMSLLLAGLGSQGRC